MNNCKQLLFASYNCSCEVRLPSYPMKICDENLDNLREMYMYLCCVTLMQDMLDLL